MKTFLLGTLLITAFSINTNAQNLIASYEFNDTTDNSANGYHLQTFGAGTDYEFRSPAESGLSSDSCIYFKDGKGLQSVSTIDNVGWKGTSVAFWIKDSLNLTAGFIIQSGTGFGIRLSSSGFITCFFNGSSSGSLISSTGIDDNKWHHVVAQNNGTTTSIYIDGILSSSQSETMFNQVDKKHYYLGVSSSWTESISAFIDDFKIYDDTLSQSQINELAGISTSGINDNNSVNTIALYPNPSQGIINIESIDKIEQVEIYNMAGERVFVRNEETEFIDISHLPNGIYTVRLISNKGIIVKKIVKN